MEKLKSEGECYFCKKSFTKRSISNHLGKHLKNMEGIESIHPPLTYYHLSVGAGPYFLEIIIQESQKLSNLDSFLRKIWLECCGHLSVFRAKGIDEISSSKTVGKVFSNVKELIYEYDFGSTTELNIKVHSTYSLRKKEPIILLSRNEPLAIMCDNCQKLSATVVCSVHIYDEDGSFFCEKCKSKHEKVCEDAADYAWMPVVNSPRAGVCGYEGGTIDTERDGVFVIKG